jgi:hypothetical protein
MAEPPPALSRDAEVVAACCFGFGAMREIVFARPQVIHPRTRVALDELTAAGLLRVEVRIFGAVAWIQAPAMCKTIRCVRMPTTAESFPITDDVLAAAVEGKARELYEASRRKADDRPPWALMKVRDHDHMRMRNCAFGKAAKALMKEATSA